MHIQVVTFGLQGLDDEEYRAGCETAAPAFAGIPGLLSKVWLRDAARGVYDGVKLWQDRPAMEAYPRATSGASSSPTLTSWTRPRRTSASSKDRPG